MDTPIYDMLTDGRLTRPAYPAMVDLIAHEQITVSISRDAAEALHRLNESHYVEACAVLGPFGLHPYDIAQPEYRRILEETR